jgi:putative serine protease PepD
MSTDDEADDDAAGIGPPLPPDDRLWRHPSELAAWGPGAGRGSLVATPADAPGRGAAWPIAVVAGLVGAALCGGVLAVTGTLSPGAERRVVEKVAMTPVVSSPTLPGEQGVAAVAEKVGPAVVRVLVTSATGTATASGVVFRDDGLLYTSAHEVVGATGIAVLLADGRRFEGRLVGADLPTDVAVVSIDTRGLTVAVLGTSDDLEVGSPTLALGSAGRGARDPSVASGVVSALDRRVDVDGESFHGLIQTDVPIEGSWAGGPLVDARGAVIGITTDIGGDHSGFCFATPIDLVRRMADELLREGKVTHGWLGIEGVDLTESEAGSMAVRGGATVRKVMGGSPAERSGLAPDDVITEVGGRPVDSSSGLVVAMRQHKPGDQVVVGYWRDGQHHETTVTIEPHP